MESEDSNLKHLKVTLDINLRLAAIQEGLDEDLSEEEILEEIGNHISDAVGHKWHDGWHYIEDCTVTSIGVS